MDGPCVLGSILNILAGPGAVCGGAPDLHAALCDVEALPRAGPRPPLPARSANLPPQRFQVKR